VGYLGNVLSGLKNNYDNSLFMDLYQENLERVVSFKAANSTTLITGKFRNSFRVLDPSNTAEPVEVVLQSVLTYRFAFNFTMVQNATHFVVYPRILILDVPGANNTATNT
jgi:hypothetical protein